MLGSISNTPTLPCRDYTGFVLVITTAQLHSPKPELRLCAGSNPIHGLSETCDLENV